jgi:anti-sigma factor RsiW
MKNDRLENWLKNIYNTQDEEISCSECFDRVARYVDVEISGVDAAAQMPEVMQHLEQCSACREEYEALRDLRRMEEDGNPPSLDDLEDSLP